MGDASVLHNVTAYSGHLRQELEHCNRDFNLGTSSYNKSFGFRRFLSVHFGPKFHRNKTCGITNEPASDHQLDLTAVCYHDVCFEHMRQASCHIRAFCLDECLDECEDEGMKIFKLPVISTM